MSEQPGSVSPPPEIEPVQQSFAERYRISPVLFALIVLFAIFVSYQIVGGLLTLLFVGSRVTTDNVMLHRVFTMVGQIFFIFLPTLVFARLLDLRFSRVFPWRVPRGGETLFAILSLFFLQEVLQIYLLFQDRIPFPEELRKIIDPAKQMIEEMFRTLVSSKSPPELLFVVLVVAVTPAVVEEFLFRGLVQSCFERSVSPGRAAFWAGLIFGVFHFNPFAVVPLIALGIFFGMLRYRSQSMILAMTVHFLNNALAVVITHFNVDEKLVAGAEKGAEANILMLLTQLVLALTLFGLTFSWYWRLTKKPSM
ncbi:MAG TPA: hypothetical protein DEP53_15730 [Bacteroidetes bacterium]|nr:hypothetical protein [Bacteroidota bacterium]